MGAKKHSNIQQQKLFFLFLGNPEVPFSKGNLVENRKPSITVSIAVAHFKIQSLEHSSFNKCSGLAFVTS